MAHVKYAPAVQAEFLLLLPPEFLSDFWRPIINPWGDCRLGIYCWSCTGELCGVGCLCQECLPLLLTSFGLFILYFLTNFSGISNDSRNSELESKKKKYEIISRNFSWIETDFTKNVQKINSREIKYINQFHKISVEYFT